MNDSRLIRSIDVSQAGGELARVVLRRETLLVNGSVGYASGTISGRVSRPYVHFRLHENDVAERLTDDYTLGNCGRRYEISTSATFPALRLCIDDDRTTFTHDGGNMRELTYQVEAERGYHSRGVLWSPGF